MSESDAQFFRQLEAGFIKAGLGKRFLRFMCVAFWHEYLPRLTQPLKWRDIYARDRFRCTSPVCERRDVTPHHIRFQGRGGGDEDDNVTSLCPFCHLEGVHRYRLRVEAPAPGARWWIGERPVLAVEGRDKRALC